MPPGINSESNCSLALGCVVGHACANTDDATGRFEAIRSSTTIPTINSMCSLDLGCVTGHAQASTVNDPMLHDSSSPLACPFALKDALRLTTWNAAALFGSVHGNHEIQRERYNQHLRLCREGDVHCVQEAHGGIGDLEMLRMDLRNHLHFGSFCANPNAGGVITSIGPALRDKCDTWSTHVISDGRCIETCGKGTRGSIKIINIHIEPALGIGRKRQLLQQVRDRIRSYNDELVFLLGDFNFLATGEQRHDIVKNIFHNDTSGLAAHFDGLFEDLTELYQSSPTRRSVVDGRICTLSRLDRIYTNAPPPEIIDASPLTNTISEAASLQHLSDHVPVRSVLQGVRSGFPDHPRIPSWVSKHPSFTQMVASTYDDLGVSDDAVQAVVDFKAIFHIAAIKVKNISCERGANTVSEKLHWALTAMRSSRSVGDEKRIGRVVKAYPELRQYIDVMAMRVIDRAALGEHIAQLANTSIEEQRRELEEMGHLPEYKKAAKVDTLRKRSEAFTKTGRKVSIAAIRGVDNQPAKSIDESVELLRDHWGRVFEACEVSDSAMGKFTPYVQVAPDIKWDIEYDEFVKLMDSKIDSGVGPDGIPYSAWKNGGSAAHKAIYNLYRSIINDGNIGEEFNESLMVFLPKGTEDMDADDVVRSPGNARPLNLSNTDAKIIAVAINQTLGDVAEAKVMQQQRGFIKGRVMGDNILEIEAYGIILSMMASMLPAMAFFDFRAAFPSIQHAWLFFVLEHMRMPMRIVRAIRKLYTNCFVHLVFGGTRHRGFKLSSGIKQGCPMSGTIFALSLDPVMRMLASCMRPDRSIITGFADDLAIVMASFMEEFPRIIKTFVIFESASGLALNFKKCVLVPLFKADYNSLREWILQHVQAAKDFMISGTAKYLGVLVGPESACLSWKAPTAKYLERVKLIRAAGNGLCQSIVDYKMYAVSVLSHVAQFEFAPKETLKTETRALQMLTAGPWNAINKELMLQLTDIGYTTEAPSISNLARAAMFRFCSRSKAFQTCIDMIEQVRRDDDDVVFVPRLEKWHRQAHISVMQANWQQLASLRLELAPKLETDLQARMYSALRRSDCNKSASDVIEARIRYWIADASAAKVARLIRRFAFIARNLPPFVATSVLKSITNCWCTSARFHDTQLPCRMCGTAGKDDLRHYVECPVVLNALKAHLPKLHQHWGNPDDSLAGFLFLGSLREKDQLLGIALAHDAILTSLNTLRTQDKIATLELASSLVKARIRQQAIRDGRARNLVQRLA